MSLLSEAMEECTILEKPTSEDGYGGYNAVYRDGAKIQAAFYEMSAQEILAAQAAQSQARIVILTRKNINLKYHDVLRRERDGKILRIVTDGDDTKTPMSAALDARKVEAEEWELPRG